MKKILFIALLAVLAASTASAQDAQHLQDIWQRTITVPNSQATIIEKLFSAWGKEFPIYFVDAYNKFKKTSKADKIKIHDEYEWDFDVDLAPKNGYLNIIAMVEMTHELTAVYWNLPNGNKLFAVCVQECYECGECEDTDFTACDCALAFYEYDVKKGTMTPRPEITDKILAKTDYVQLPKEGRDLEYWDAEAGEHKKIKWNGNGF